MIMLHYSPSAYLPGVHRMAYKSYLKLRPAFSITKIISLFRIILRHFDWSTIILSCKKGELASSNYSAS